MKWTDSQREKLQTLQNEHELLAPWGGASSQKTSREGRVQKPPGNSTACTTFQGGEMSPKTTFQTNLQLSKFTPETDQPQFKLWKHILGALVSHSITQGNLQIATKNAQ